MTYPIPFKVGQKVRCINFEGRSGEELECVRDKPVTVHSCDNALGLMFLEEFPNTGFKVERFVLWVEEFYNPYKKVETIGLIKADYFQITKEVCGRY